ncbi:MSHA pilin protein MshC [Gammaproteobacteria bacterium]
MNRSAGFTLIELVMVIIILGILAMVAMPRMDTSGYRELEFHDKVVAALRYAQKTATSHRRQVCVVFTASTVTLTIALTNPGACNQALNLPVSNSNVVQSGDAINAIFNPVPAGFNFLPDGSGVDKILPVSGQPDISVVGATGHVQ